MKIKSIFLDLYYLFFPKTCFGCDKLLSYHENILCSFCQIDISTVCFKDPKHNEIITLMQPLKIYSANALLHFKDKGIVQNLIHQLKYKKQIQIGFFLGNWFAEVIHSQIEFLKVEAIIPVPLHPKRERKRGYNQLDAFGKALAEKLNVPYVKDYMIRNKNTPSLAVSSANLEERERIVQNVFSINPKLQTTYTHFLLIDDVITTGATIKSCAKTLLEKKNAVVRIASISLANF